MNGESEQTKIARIEERVKALAAKDQAQYDSLCKKIDRIQIWVQAETIFIILGVLGLGVKLLTG